MSTNVDTQCKGATLSICIYPSKLDVSSPGYGFCISPCLRIHYALQFFLTLMHAKLLIEH